MPLFARYLLSNYLKVLVLAVLSFIAILLVSRLEEIAHFATIGAPLSYLSLFILYQIPYILPIALPISCLISAMILYQRLSHTRELTALRAGGFSLRQIVAPVLVAGALLSLLCFYITSELATTSHLATRKMVYDLTSKNPLILLQSAKIAKLKGAYVQMDPVHNGQSAKNLLIALRNDDRLHLCMAKKVKMDHGDLKGEQVSLITSRPEESTLIVENQERLTTSAAELAPLLRKQGWKIAGDHLKLSLLRLRGQSLRAEGAWTRLAKCHSEMVRRASLGLAAFTFTLMGVAFGMEISRNRTKRGLLIAIFLTALTLITFFVGKEFDHVLWLASALFLVPHVLIVATSIYSLYRISRGIE